ncbi:hypothetical protein DY000_02034993 [Brassica cretica]|uniref:Leucine-rich repeat-containing N-terminal plant-type domain-containing protein n=1 Tax=Brassica cretica TaxID=69181 RepID=A0ABQ7DDN2_BRACR|nr:hypothetical protein DY000_02034993 [Brassica cretica]
MLRLRNCLSGTLKPNSSLFRLHHLRYLALSQKKTSSHLHFLLNLAISTGYNNFRSLLPSEFGNLNGLEVLSLSTNDFFGQVRPTISNLTSLTKLNLNHNQITGSFPLPLFLTKSLSLLDLSSNSISPARLGSKSDIPTNLVSLRLSRCNISEFPNMLKILEKLELVELSDNRIKGKVPEWLWNLPCLNTVFLKNNLFDGFKGPADVLVNSSVKNLFMEQNYFEGEIPPILPLSINLLAASDNRFTGRIPLSICNYKSLEILELGYNNLTRPIPQCLSNLIVVKLRKNSLEGSIPDTFYIGVSLQTFDVGHNRLTGKLPRSLQNCSSLEFLVVDHN